MTLDDVCFDIIISNEGNKRKNLLVFLFSGVFLFVPPSLKSHTDFRCCRCCCWQQEFFFFLFSFLWFHFLRIFYFVRWCFIEAKIMIVCVVVRRLVNFDFSWRRRRRKIKMGKSGSRVFILLCRFALFCDCFYFRDCRAREERNDEEEQHDLVDLL